MRVVNELLIDLVGAEELRWDGYGTEPTGDCTFLCGKGNENYELGRDFFVHK
jgi:hypothetical protein